MGRGISSVSDMVMHHVEDDDDLHDLDLSELDTCKCQDS